MTEHRSIKHLASEIERLEKELTLKNEIISDQADKIVELNLEAISWRNKFYARSNIVK